VDQISKSFCVVPWVQVATNATGLYRICCNGLPKKNLVYDDNNLPMRVSKNSLEDVWNSPSYIKIREQFLSGERPEMCRRCFGEEDSGVQSARIKANSKWAAIKPTQAIVPVGALYLDLRLGNLCNLKCRMCNPYASSKWIDDWNSIVDHAQLVPNERLSDDEVVRLKTLDWPTRKETWTNLEPILNTVEEIYLTGGEPFLSIEQTKLLRRLIDNGRAKDIVLKYNTNLTVLPKTIVNLWPEFKKVILNVSMDGIGKLNEYIRFPTQWNTVVDNLTELFNLKEQGLPLEINAHVTIQMYNILNLSEILVYLKENYQIEPYLNILNHPHCLNIRTLTQDLKQVAEERLLPYSNYERVQEVISYMKSEDWSDKHFNEFVQYTKSLDQKRGENFNIVSNDFVNSF
jgi:MoaA/NifB/PqqE/SkfB family radical SAM enzyme